MVIEKNFYTKVSFITMNIDNILMPLVEMVIFPFMGILLISGCPPMLTVDNFVWYRNKIWSTLVPAVGELWKKSYVPRFACASEGYQFLFAKIICWSLGWREIWFKGGDYTKNESFVKSSGWWSWCTVPCLMIHGECVWWTANSLVRRTANFFF